MNLVHVLACVVFALGTLFLAAQVCSIIGAVTFDIPEKDRRWFPNWLANLLFHILTVAGFASAVIVVCELGGGYPEWLQATTGWLRLAGGTGIAWTAMDAFVRFLVECELD